MKLARQSYETHTGFMSDAGGEGKRSCKGLAPRSEGL
jgi:hypothetical protein